MKKTKIYLYPFIFSAVFIAIWITIGMIYNAIDNFALALLIQLVFFFVWVIVALPIYCIRYSKIIINEKSKFALSIYNSLLIMMTHILPLNLGETTGFKLFILWVLFWSLTPLILQLNKSKNQNDNENK